MHRSLTREASQAFDRDAIQRLGVPGCVLMENAGRACVDQLERLGINGAVVVLCGKGNNGGDGFVVARHLAVRNYPVKVALAAAPSDLSGDALLMFDILTHCRVPILDTSGVNPALFLEELDRLATGAEWIVDALLGTGATGDPRPPYDTLIDWMNGERARRLAIDLPSGLDCDTGEPGAPTVRAEHTITMVAAKAGFANAVAAPYVGEVHIVDIGAPFHAE